MSKHPTNKKNERCERRFYHSQYSTDPRFNLASHGDYHRFFYGAPVIHVSNHFSIGSIGVGELFMVASMVLLAFAKYWPIKSLITRSCVGRSREMNANLTISTTGFRCLGGILYHLFAHVRKLPKLKPRAKKAAATAMNVS